MADYKSNYSENSSLYVDFTVDESEDEMIRYQKSRARRDRHMTEWVYGPVNLNEICERFTPDVCGFQSNEKFIYMNDAYVVIADMASGYVRIYDRKLKAYLTPNGTPSTEDRFTHFRILKREEM